MRILIVEPNKVAYEAEIGGSLENMQKLVGGYIQAVYPYEEPVALICNEEGIMEGLPLNRAVRDKNGKIDNIIMGTFFICGLSETNFASLTPEHMEKFKEKFYYPEMFMRHGNDIIAIKVIEKSSKNLVPEQNLQ